MIRARVFVTLKGSVLDPQGKAVRNGLLSLGYEEVQGVRQGKVFDVELEVSDEAQARTRLEEMCKRLLANTVIEDYSFELLSEASA